jgi:hypothetical protein
MGLESGFRGFAAQGQWIPGLEPHWIWATRLRTSNLELHQGEVDNHKTGKYR